MRLAGTRVLLVSAVLFPALGGAADVGKSGGGKTAYDEALSEYRAGRIERAEERLEKALAGGEAGARGAGALSLLGWCRLRLARLESSRRSFEMAIRANPKAADPRTGLGYVTLRQRRPSEAVASFREALALDPASAEAWKGMGMARRDMDDVSGARADFTRAASLDPSDAEARQLLEQSLGAGEILLEKRARGPEPAETALRLVSRTGKGRIEVKEGERFRPLFLKGVNLGTALPGKFPAQFPDDPALYRRWFDQIGDLGANVVRVYTLHPPSLYRALREHNAERPGQKLWLVQGVWTELPEDDDYDAPGFLEGFHDEIHRVIDAIHGNVEIPPRPGHAHGRYDADLSGDLLAWLLGREWEPFSVQAYERSRAGKRGVDGSYVRAAENASPFECWLASICDEAARYETEQHRWQHPVGYVSWPTLDPLRHPTEATAAEETAIRLARGETLSEPIREYDNDAVNIDALRIVATERFPAGFFASYHAYPYYPDFIGLDRGYGAARDGEGPSHYFGYLQALKAHHGSQPVVIAEFGVPSSRGIAHIQPELQHHGGHSTVEQGKIDARLFHDIRDAGLAGGILFSWMDEWFKRNWLVMSYESPPDRKPLWLNTLDPEENYGLLAAWPGKDGWKIRVDGRGEDWDSVKPFYAVARQERWGRLMAFRVTSDEAYLYLRLDLRTDAGRRALDWGDYWIGIDTYDARLGEHLFPPPAGVSTPIGMEFLVQLSGRVSSGIRVARPYDLFTMRNQRPYRSVERHEGDFVKIQVFTNRDRFGRDGTYYPAKSYDRTPLRRGSLEPDSPDYDTLADWMESPEGDFIEARIPWGLLNVADPSSLRVIHEERPHTGPVDTRVTEGFRFHVLSLGPKDGGWGVVDQFPRSSRPSLSDYPLYRWNGWEEPSYHLVLKDSYEILRQALRTIPEYSDAH